MAITPVFTFILFILPLSASIVNADDAKPTRFDITKYGVPTGSKLDISKAIQKAWADACASQTPASVVIPKGTWLLKQILLTGGCKSNMSLFIQGTLKAPMGALPNPNGDWITINHVDGLEISGGGVLNGQGKKAWLANDCGTNNKCAKNPMNLVFNFVDNLYIHDITTKDSKNFHVHYYAGKNTVFERFTISAPGESVNTDGIHLSHATNVTITDSVIQTGDDCVSIGDDSQNLTIMNTHCGPGHGISVGSLGKNQAEKDVEGIYVKNCTFNSTDNGIRIKTWPSAPATLSVKNLRFEDLTMNNVQYPIIIDQEYCPYNKCDKNSPSLVKISDVYINNVWGTSSHPDVVTFTCSKSTYCKNVVVGNIDIKYNGREGNGAISKCNNVEFKTFGKQYPTLCTKPSY